MSKSDAVLKIEAETAARVAALDAIKITQRGAMASKSMLKREEMCAKERFKREDHMRTDWAHTLPGNVPYERIFEPWYWRPVGAQLHIGNEITVINDSLTLWARLLVVSADPVSGDTVVKELIRKDLELVAVSGTEQSGFSAEYRGMHEQWCVVRDHDGHTMAKGLRSRDDAMYRIRTEFIPRRGIN